MQTGKSAYDISIVAAFLRQRYGVTVDPAQMAEGQESQAFAFAIGDRGYVIRINADIEGFIKDDYAYRNFSSNRIPIPKITEYGRFTDSHAYCVSEMTRGITYQDADEPTVEALLPDVTELWKSIGVADVSMTAGYGVFSGYDGCAPFGSWRGYLLSAADERRRDRNAAPRSPGYDAALVGDMIRAMMELLPYCPEDRKLIHGDFGSNNLLVDARANRITAVIDWDNAKYGDPIYDVAIAYFWKDWLMCMRKSCRHWDKELSDMPNYRERIKCYQLHIGLDEIRENAARENTRTLLWLQERCRRLLNKET